MSDGNNIYESRSAHDWAKYFMEIKDGTNFTIDEGLMIGWFANAMMAMYDSIHNNEIRTLQSRIKELEDVVRKLSQSLERLSRSGDGTHGGKRASFYDCLPTLQIEFTERQEFAREIIQKHKDLINQLKHNKG